MLKYQGNLLKKLLLRKFNSVFTLDNVNQIVFQG